MTTCVKWQVSQSCLNFLLWSVYFYAFFKGKSSYLITSEVNSYNFHLTVRIKAEKPGEHKDPRKCSGI